MPTHTIGGLHCGCGHTTVQHTDMCDECACPGFHGRHRIVETSINGHWPLLLPSWRAYRPEWPVWEQEHISAVRQAILSAEDPAVVVDVGAEQGDMPALWASWGAAVVMVEPNPVAWPNIRTVWGANNLAPLEAHVGFAAADDWAGNPDFDATPDPLWPACAYGPLMPNTGFRHLSEQGADVGPRFKLDTLAEQGGWQPDVITLDVEGSEFEVLKGAERILREDRPTVVCSVHPEFMADMWGYGPDELYRWMGRLGYERETLAVDHEHHVRFTPTQAR